MNPSSTNPFGMTNPGGQNPGNISNPQPISSGSDDIILSGGSSKKKPQKGMIILIVIMVLIGIVGCAYLLWQNGAFGGGSNNGQQQSQTSLESKYNSYVNYVLWGVESDGRPDLSAMESVGNPYFESLRTNGSSLDTYLEKANQKYSDLLAAYESQSSITDINLAVVKSYFQEFPGITWLSFPDLVMAYQQAGANEAQQLIERTYQSSDKEQYLGETLKAYSDSAVATLSIIEEASNAGCIQNYQVADGCYTLTEQDETKQADNFIKTSIAQNTLNHHAMESLGQLYTNMYGNNEGAQDG